MKNSKRVCSPAGKPLPTGKAAACAVVCVYYAYPALFIFFSCDCRNDSVNLLTFFRFDMLISV